MTMPDFSVLGSYLVGLMMSIGAVCVFVWAVLSGALHNADEASLNHYKAEIENERRRQAGAQ
jgi:hypothetical protein